MISENVLKTLKEATTLSDIVGRVVKLSKNGRGFTGLCPFHSEKTPSFHVSDEKGFFYCFGCQKSGDVFTFLQDAEKLTFRQAALQLSDLYGVPLEESEQEGGVTRVELFKSNRLVLERWSKNLELSAEALEWLAKRGIDRSTIEDFQLGFSLDSWDDCVAFLKKQSLRDEAIVQSGLAIDSKGRVYDRFRNRVMIPIFDLQNRVVGYGGRTLGDDSAKYINSPETPLFKKGEILYGLNRSHEAIKHKGYAVLTEGYFDVISLTKAGVDNCVAGLGTAFTRAQAILLKKFTSKCVVAYDADKAGRAATLKALELLLNEGFEVKIARFPDGMDADDFSRNSPRQDVIKLFKNTIPWVEFLCAYEKNGDSSKTAISRTHAIQTAVSMVYNIEDILQRRTYFDLVMDGFSVDRVTREGIWSNIDKPIEVASSEADIKSIYPVEERILELYYRSPQLQAHLEHALSDLSDLQNHWLVILIREGSLRDVETLPEELSSIVMKAMATAETENILDEEEEVNKCLVALLTLEMQQQIAALQKKLEEGSAENKAELIATQLGYLQKLRTLA